MEKISLPVRIFATVLVLVGAAGMLMLRTMGPADAPVAIPQPVQVAAKAPTKPAAKAAPAKAAKPAKPSKAAPAVNAPKAVKQLPPTGFPTVVDRALRTHEVLVVSLVVPGSRVDELAAAEAEAGARLGGAGFLSLNVLNESVARALLLKLDSVQDPGVLVLKQSGEVALELAGFVDRETVAQAAAAASS